MASMARIFSRIIGASLAASLLAAPVVASAQDNVDESRLRKIEAEVRALQRKVFPGGDGRFFEPQITAEEQARTSTNTPSTTAMTDSLARLDALEAQLQLLTARSEENANALAQLETRLTALEPASAQIRVEDANQPSAANANLSAMTGGASQAALPAPAPSIMPASKPAGPSEERLAAVRAITKPQTEDAGADEYSYGFRLWTAGFFPEARQQLGIFLERYPSHPMVTYGRNLMGRAFLDDGQAEEAARWFLRNYQGDKQGLRAGDSLLFLAESMTKMGDTKRACIALAEFGETYPALATGRLQQQYEANRQKVTCN
jgi:TolA-binding protein